MSDPRPIGFFDSGLGGLTVLRATRRQFPFENLVYLGDTARLPYGNKSPETIFRYTLQNIRALCKLNVKAIVVACNSASTSILRSRKSPEETRVLEDSQTQGGERIPLYNVIEPGAEAALEASTSKRIAVLGTRATVASMAYVQAIAARDPNAIVFQAAAPLLVPLVEEGWEGDPLTNLIVYRYLGPLLSNKVDTLILGCTHYPALHESIRRVTGNSVQLIDSALAIAKLIERDFNSGTLKPHQSKAHGNLELLATDASPSMGPSAQRIMGSPDLLDFKPFDIV